MKKKTKKIIKQILDEVKQNGFTIKYDTKEYEETTDEFLGLILFGTEEEKKKSVVNEVIFHSKLNDVVVFANSKSQKYKDFVHDEFLFWRDLDKRLNKKKKK